MIQRTDLHRVEQEVKLVRWDIEVPPSRGGPRSVELIHLTDLQVGARAFNRPRFLEYREWILSKRYRYVLLGGDLIDSATKLSKANPYENTSEPIWQVKEVVELLRPLQGRILGYVGGNHERRTIPTFGDSGALIAERLEVPYSRGVQLLDIHFGLHRPFKVSLWHGGGAARTKGAKAQMLHRFMSQADSTVYLVGHIHDSLLLWDWREERRAGKSRLQKIVGIMSSSFLDYWGTYAEVAAMSPSDTMMARIVLEPSGHWEVTMR